MSLLAQNQPFSLELTPDQVDAQDISDAIDKLNEQYEAISNFGYLTITAYGVNTIFQNPVGGANDSEILFTHNLGYKPIFEVYRYAIDGNGNPFWQPLPMPMAGNFVQAYADSVNLYVIQSGPGLGLDMQFFYLLFNNPSAAS